MKPKRWWWFDGRARLVRQLAAPAVICDSHGDVRAGNAAAASLVGHLERLPRGWGRQSTPQLGPFATQVIPLAHGDQLHVARIDAPAEGAAPSTTQLYRSMRDTLFRVISTVAHDLRSPLASLVFNIGVLRSRWRALPPSEVDRTLEAMARACELEMKAVAELVEQVSSDSSRGTDLSDLFARIEELLSPLFRDQDDRLLLTVERGLRVNAAPMVLEQIFVNLIRNASESRAVAVTVRVACRRRGRSVAVQVANDGPPIPAASRARIFEPFFSTKPTGTGMGLVFAREAARDLGGDLRILPGDATVFEVLLPLDDSPSSGPPARAGGVTRKGA